MSLERYQGWAWLTCDADVAIGCDSETEAVMGDVNEAKERGRLDRWSVGEGQGERDLCPNCKPIDAAKVAP